MATLEIHQFPCLSDNYGVLIHDAENNVTASIDAPEAAAVKKALAEKGWTLTHILTTHYHADHTGGNLELKGETGCTIVGPKNEADRVPGIDVQVGDGDTVSFGAFTAKVFDTPGHTAGHIAFYAPDIDGTPLLFCGDTLFSAGCGRLFEGTPAQMHDSLARLAALPGNTRVCCTHEYTLSNLRFALTVEPDNAELVAYAERCRELRARNLPTLPSSIQLEREVNPFLRAHLPSVAQGARRYQQPPTSDDPVAVLTALRAWKDVF